MKKTSFARPGVLKYVLGSYPGLSQLVEDEEDEISSFSASWTADCATSYVSPEMLRRFTRVSLLISLISFPLPPDCFALSICALTKVQMIWNTFSSQSAGTKNFWSCDNVKQVSRGLSPLLLLFCHDFLSLFCHDLLSLFCQFLLSLFCHGLLLPLVPWLAVVVTFALVV